MNPSISIILVEPESCGNIGAVCRAMKNMGLSDLRCVKPPAGWKRKSKLMAVSAADVLKNAKNYAALSKAVADSFWVIGTTRRKGQRRGNFVEFEKAVASITEKSKHGRVAILFGKESKGLDNHSLAMCDATVTIPSHESYPSLNLAQAVMVITFSLFFKNNSQTALTENLENNFCEKKEVAESLQCFKKALVALNYERPGDNRLERILSTFQGVFKRGGMLETEAQMIKGLSRRIIQQTEAAQTVKKITPPVKKC